MSEGYSTWTKHIERREKSKQRPKTGGCERQNDSIKTPFPYPLMDVRDTRGLRTVEMKEW